MNFIQSNVGKGAEIALPIQLIFKKTRTLLFNSNVL